MIRFLFFISFVLSFNLAVCQIVYPYQDIKLEKPSDYKETEPLALSAANALLTTPFEPADEGRKGALGFLIKWMNGTKDYSFYLQGIAAEISDEKDLLGIYVAAMAKFSLENKTEALNPLNTEGKVCSMVLAYCDDAGNNFKLKKKYRKMLEKK